ncbi:MAG TPA: hypothetical protein VHY35_21500 [Stellaceae bacterium]|nr:hypothetical protein [Stellaceae bacterium]
MPRPLVLIHGYSDKGASFQAWRDRLTQIAPSRPIETISTCTYQSLTDDVTIKDLADGLERALRARFSEPTRASFAAGNQAAWQWPQGFQFDAIVHSTGMLVLREWLARDRRRLSCLKHLVALAPATFGSPLARLGRSWLGAVFKGSKHLGPDFLAAGDAILDGLELASSYTWELANRDVFNEKPFYDNGPDTPYVFVFCGTDAYDGIRELANTPGMDGTVRWAGASFNTRKIILDLTRETKQAVRAADWMAINVPVHLLPGMNHGTILSAPTDDLVQLVKTALDVETSDNFNAWLKNADAAGKAEIVAADPDKGAWQQMIVRCVDQRGDPIKDYHITVFDGDDVVTGFDDEHVAVYSRDSSYRCFHFNLNALFARKTLQIKIMALSGSQWVDYQGFGWESPGAPHHSPTANEAWDAVFDLTDQLRHDLKTHNDVVAGNTTFNNERLFAPFTTTLVEIRLDRDAFPYELEKISKLLGWDDDAAAVG